MIFNSHIFLFLFLPLTLVGYFTLNRLRLHQAASLFLLAMSLWFYAYFNIGYLLIILSSICVNFCLYKVFCKNIGKTQRRLLLILGLILNLGCLFYFKYFDFFLSNLNRFFGSDFALHNILLPLGISFFTFQQLSFLIDSYKCQTPKYSFLNYALFVSLFPQLIAGPIVTHDELAPQFDDLSKRKLNWDNLSSGLYLFVLGLGKKVLLADTFGGAVNIGFSDIAALNTTDALIVTLAFTFQIYFDFSGYCDMACAIARMLNIDLPLNFNSPYKALTVTEFWERWHMTLTRFFKKYLYIPLGGNRKGKIISYINVMIVFTVSGIWHGANWTFIAWGMLHGAFNVISRVLRRFFDAMHPALSWIITFTFLNLTWVFFRADSIADALRMLRKFLLMNFGPINAEITKAFTLPELPLVFNTLFRFDLSARFPQIYLGAFFVLALFIVLSGKNAYERAQHFRPSLLKVFSTSVLLIWCIFSMSGMSTFLYYNF